MYRLIKCNKNCKEQQFTVHHKFSVVAINLLLKAPVTIICDLLTVLFRYYET